MFETESKNEKNGWADNIVQPFKCKNFFAASPIEATLSISEVKS